MGYFSNRAIELEEECAWEENKRYWQLYYQLSDLRNRLLELNGLTPIPDDRIRICTDDLLYVLPEDLNTTTDVLDAISLIQKEFWELCGFHVDFDPAIPDLAREYEQITLFCWPLLAGSQAVV